LIDKGDTFILIGRIGVELMKNSVGNLTKAEFGGDVLRTRPRIRYGLFGLGVVILFLAVIIWPFDETLSNMLCISRVGHVATPLWWETLKGVRVFGKGDILFLLGILLAIHRPKQVAVYACIAAILAGLIVTPMKYIIGRSRPDGSNKMSFPSGDVASLTAFLVPIASTFPAIRPIAFAGVVTVGAVRVSNGFHFPSDILAGVAMGIFAGAIVLSIKFSLKPRVRRLLRRSWLAALLGIIVLIHLFLPRVGNFRTFFSIFGPSVALLAVAPFIRARLRTRRHIDRRLIFGMIFSLGGAALVMASWFTIALVSVLGSRLPDGRPADPGPVWAIIGVGCVLLFMTFLSLREYGAGRYKSTVGILAVGVADLIFTIIISIALHGWAVWGLVIPG
jgi:membrane-associated phospholipid phosphatase